MSQERGQAFLLQLPAIGRDLPFSPVLFQALFRQTGDAASATLRDVADTISKDQSLTAKVLTMANSAYYGLQSEVRTIDRAVAVLGLNEIRRMVLVLGAQAVTGGGRLPPAFDRQAYWEHQFAVGVAARTLAPALGALDPEQLFTAGVLHDFGKILTASRRPEDWEAEARLAAGEDLPWHEAEQRHWGLDHGLIGAMVLKSWNIPEELCEPINWHHAPLRAPERRREALALCLADAMVLGLTALHAPVKCPWREILARFRLSPEATLDAVAAAVAARNVSSFAALA